MLPTVPLAWVIKFCFIGWCSYAWRLWAYLASCHPFPANCSHVQRPWWCSMFDDAVLVSSVYVIMGLAHCIKMYVTVVWGSLFPWHTATEGPGSDLDQGGPSTPSSGSEHCGTLLLGSPSPWMLWFEQLVLSITFCVSHKPQPVCTQAVFSLLVIVCALGLKAPHQE